MFSLLKDYENADTELLIYGSTLINKTLSGLSDQDSFYDESDHLEQQGMEGVVQRYMSRPGTDLDLLDQLQLYEAVLKFEDGESDGVRIPDNSVRKTLRQRTPHPATGTSGSGHASPLGTAASRSALQSPATTAAALADMPPFERRKSRRHSTGNTPLLLASTPPTMHSTTHPKGYTPNMLLTIQQTVDEDSSGSGSNSTDPMSPGSTLNGTELAAGFGVPKSSSATVLAGAGVTPGLRRRRERAERQKTFMREQQDASARALEATRTGVEETSSNQGRFRFGSEKDCRVVCALFACAIILDSGNVCVFGVQC